MKCVEGANQEREIVKVCVPDTGRDDGSPCDDDFQCNSKACYIRIIGNLPRGTCQAGAVGDDCRGSPGNAGCAPYNYCNINGGKCAAKTVGSGCESLNIESSEGPNFTLFCVTSGINSCQNGQKDSRCDVGDSDCLPGLECINATGVVAYCSDGTDGSICDPANPGHCNSNYCADNWYPYNNTCAPAP